MWRLTRAKFCQLSTTPALWQLSPDSSSKIRFLDGKFPHVGPPMVQFNADYGCFFEVTDTQWQESWGLVIKVRCVSTVIIAIIKFYNTETVNILCAYAKVARSLLYVTITVNALRQVPQSLYHVMQPPVQIAHPNCPSCERQLSDPLSIMLHERPSKLPSAKAFQT